MSNLILNNKDLFRAERLFSERVSNPIKSNSFYKSDYHSTSNEHGTVVFNKFISRLLKEAKEYRIVNL